VEDWGSLMGGESCKGSWSDGWNRLVSRSLGGDGSSGKVSQVAVRPDTPDCAVSSGARTRDVEGGRRVLPANWGGYVLCFDARYYGVDLLPFSEVGRRGSGILLESR
jgi:hypothetical protein